ncbi:hypothetical protein LOD99_4051 [Oopsacas minuta]|uniref:Uncharacterized protein n=1 Tax=Oopsacas minuta TaxID=111878 RepID=A0AAV7JWU0_9METZ|nr:hypothetical protein LOD99_4051 [Oopsacas minuta]
MFWKSEKLSTCTKTIKFSFCCGEGKVVLSPLDTSELLTHLLTATGKRAIKFRSNIRVYNPCLAFCSLRANVDNELANAKLGSIRSGYIGQYTIQSVDLSPSKSSPKFPQIYIHDETPEAELEIVRDT